MYDTYDFNKDDKRAIVQAGRQQMIKGNLKPYFTIHEVIIPRDKIQEVFKLKL